MSTVFYFTAPVVYISHDVKMLILDMSLMYWRFVFLLYLDLPEEDGDLSSKHLGQYRLTCDINLLGPELFFLILAHSVYKM